VRAVWEILETADQGLAAVERTLAALRDVQVPAFREALRAAGVSVPGARAPDRVSPRAANSRLSHGA
jgi:hypothetical protein